VIADHGARPQQRRRPAHAAAGPRLAHTLLGMSVRWDCLPEEGAWLGPSRTFKDFTLGAAVVLVGKPHHALMASQRKDTPATTRDRPYGVHRAPFQAMCCPSCTSDLESALVGVEPAGAEANRLEREHSRRVSCQQPVCPGALRSSGDHPGRMVTPGVLAERLQTRVGCTIHLPRYSRPPRRVTPPGPPQGGGPAARAQAQAPRPRTRAWGEDARRGESDGAPRHADTRSHTNGEARGSRQCPPPCSHPKDGAGNGGLWSRGRRRRGDQPPTWARERVEGSTTMQARDHR
jgi:hypothetical protein